MKVQIASPDGRKGYIPIENLGKAMDRGYQVLEGGDVTPVFSNETNSNKIRIMSPEGRFGYVTPNKLEAAIARGFRVMPASSTLSQQMPQGDSWGSLIGKSALKVPMSLLDIPKAAVGLAEATQNHPRGIPTPYGDFIDEPDIPRGNIDISSKMPDSNTARKFIQDKTGVDLTPRPTGALQRIAGNAVEWATPLGFAGKGATLATKAAKAAKLASTGAGIGATSGVLQEGGLDPLVADIGSSIVAPNPGNLLKNFSKVKDTAKLIPLKFMGLDPKNFDLKTAKAARDLGIDLPASALTQSNVAGYLDQWIGKTPFYGNKLRNKYAKAEEAVYKNLNDIYNSTGPARTPEIEARISNLYDAAEHALPQDARIKPHNLKNAVDKIKINTATLSDDEAALLKRLEAIKNDIEPTSMLSSQYGPVKLPIQDYNVDKLVGTKKSLNSIIKWNKDEGVKNQLRGVQRAITKDINEYGKHNPEWYGKFKEADNLYKDVSRREKLETLLSDKPTNHATERLSFNALSKAINTPDNKKLLQKQVSPETFAKMEKLGEVAKAMAIKNQNIPNPSGTAMTAATLGFASSLFTNPLGTLSLSGAGAFIGAHVATKLLTDKKLIDWAIQMAEKPNNPGLPLIAAFNKRVKDISGYSTVTLMRHLNDEEQEGGLNNGL